MKTPSKVKSLYLECTCVGISQKKWDNLMRGKSKADKKKVNNIVKEHLPDLYKQLNLNLYNPYDYLKTKTHLILIHSSIEYFLRYEV